MINERTPIFQAGQEVMVDDPERFHQPMRDKLKNRRGIVKENVMDYGPGVGAKKQFYGRVVVVWQKRGNRGQEFTEYMNERWLRPWVEQAV